MKKRDIDFIPKLGITETRRDQLAKRDWSKRLEHPEPADNWTSAECEEKKFSGIRINKLNGRTEIWCVGMLKVSRNTQQVANNPGLLATMHEEAFATRGTVLEIELDKKRVMQRRSGKREDG